MKDLTLNNNQIANFFYTDSWDRPVYKLEDGMKVCCVNLDGTYLHAMSKEGEPDYPLEHAYQPTGE